LPGSTAPASANRPTVQAEGSSTMALVPGSKRCALPILLTRRSAPFLFEPVHQRLNGRVRKPALPPAGSRESLAPNWLPASSTAPGYVSRLSTDASCACLRLSCSPTYNVYPTTRHVARKRCQDEFAMQALLRLLWSCLLLGLVSLPLPRVVREGSAHLAGKPQCPLQLVAQRSYRHVDPEC
jgi:hypothetical protein